MGFFCSTEEKSRLFDQASSVVPTVSKDDVQSGVSDSMKFTSSDCGAIYDFFIICYLYGFNVYFIRNL